MEAPREREERREGTVTAMATDRSIDRSIGCPQDQPCISQRSERGRENPGRRRGVCMSVRLPSPQIIQIIQENAPRNALYAPGALDKNGPH